MTIVNLSQLRIACQEQHTLSSSAVRAHPPLAPCITCEQWCHGMTLAHEPVSGNILLDNSVVLVLYS